MQLFDYVDCDRILLLGVGFGRESGKMNFYYLVCQVFFWSQEMLGGKVVIDISQFMIK